MPTQRGSGSIAHEHLDGRWRGRQGTRRAVGEDPVTPGIVQRDPGTRHGGIPHELPDRLAQGHVRCLSRERACDPVQRRRLPCTGLRLVGALGAHARQPADDDGDEQEQHEVEPLPRVRDREREPRLREQQVVDEEGPDRRRDAGRRAVAGRDDDHGDEVQRRPVELAGRLALDDADREGGDREQGGDEGGRPQRDADRRAGGRLERRRGLVGHARILVPRCASVAA